jgi:hypothetical protein
MNERQSTFSAETVKVPQMAESISEGTLKSWSKKEGDTVQVDEEVATIETDKVRLGSTWFRSNSSLNEVLNAIP